MVKESRLRARVLIDIAIVIVVLILGIRFMVRYSQRERPITDELLLPLNELIRPTQSDLKITSNLVLLMCASVSCPACQADAQTLASIPDSILSNTSIFIVTQSGDGRVMAEFSRIYANNLPVAEALDAFTQFFSIDHVPRYFLLDYRLNKVLSTNWSVRSLWRNIEIIQAWESKE